MEVKLGILTALWGRPKLTVLFLKRLQALSAKFGITCVAVGSEGKPLEDRCREYGVEYIDHPNKPLGRKWNYGLQVFKNFPEVTHVMILGSDDFVSDDFVEYIIGFMTKHETDFFGCVDVYMFGANPKRRGFGQFYYFTYSGYLVGPGRCYSRKAIDLLDWQIWGDMRNFGLDGSAVKRIKTVYPQIQKYSFKMQREGLFMVDIKTQGNISTIPGAAHKIEGFVERLREEFPEAEAEGIIKLIKEQNAI